MGHSSLIDGKNTSACLIFHANRLITRVSVRSSVFGIATLKLLKQTAGVWSGSISSVCIIHLKNS